MSTASASRVCVAELVEECSEGYRPQNVERASTYTPYVRVGFIVNGRLPKTGTLLYLRHNLISVPYNDQKVSILASLQRWVEIEVRGVAAVT